jgi:hypothetical protein
MEARQLKLSEQLVQQIKPLLAGKDAIEVGIALADLTALWIAGHVVINDEAKTLEMRSSLFAAHCAIVRDLTKLNAQDLDSILFGK